MFLALDVETTGLDPWRDELLSVSGVWDDLSVAIDQYMKPAFHSEWPEAEVVNGISSARVRNCNVPYFYREELQRLVDEADYIVGYNFSFDRAFLEHIGVCFDGKAIVDVMHQAAPIWGMWRPDRVAFKWPKLTEVAGELYGYRFPAHSSLEDARATMYCHLQMTKTVYMEG